MRQIVFRRTGPPSVLELEEVPDLTPGPGEVRIAVEAAGVNFADLMARMGVYPDAPPLPSVVGYEVAGTVDAVGDGVDPGRVGEPVVALTRFGGYATQVVVAGFQAVRRPDGLGAVEGAGIPVVGLTAWMLCEVMGRARAGDRVLVHSAAGGVGLAALDLLKWRGATAVGTASAAKHERLLARGYDQLVDYRTEDFEAVLAEGPGFDLVLDPVGGASWAKGLRLLRPGGRLGCFGFSAMAGSERRSLWSAVSAGFAVPWLQVNPVSLMNANKGVFGVNMGHLWDEGERVAGWLAELLVLWEQGVLRPHVHGTFPFDDVAGAHALLHGRGSFGKVVLVP